MVKSDQMTPKFRNRSERRRWFESLAGQALDNFELCSFVGSGNIGYVYRARDKSVEGREVAVKIVPSEQVSARDQWENELSKVSKLSTVPGVAHFHGQGDGRLKHGDHTELVLYTVWEYIHPGRNLTDYLQENAGAIPVSFVMGVLRTVLMVLHACQKKGVPRHGDLKASNILVGEPDEADLDPVTLQPRDRVFISDFGYGTTGGSIRPKDDFAGLHEIIQQLVDEVDWNRANAHDKRLLSRFPAFLGKALAETTESERWRPVDILRGLNQMDATAERTDRTATGRANRSGPSGSTDAQTSSLTVGQYQVSEMLGDKWDLWKRLFVPSVPALSRILDADISTFVTGPRGCGKTMLFRRLSKRLMIECGPISELQPELALVGLYVNANDIADAFARFPDSPSAQDEQRLTCYLNLCLLSEILGVEQIASALPADELIRALAEWFGSDLIGSALVTNEDALDHYRAVLERIKWSFPTGDPSVFPAYSDFAQAAWLPRFVAFVRRACSWVGPAPLFVFVDDYTVPRVSASMQRVLNRTLLNRSAEFVAKIATEAATTFVAEDSTGKVLQDGDDYQLIDMGEESLFLTDRERSEFLNKVFERRLSADARVPRSAATVPAVLGSLGMSKTEFARRLRSGSNAEAGRTADAPSKRRGAAKAAVLYRGHEVFAALWSGDTRMMIQLMQELVDQAMSSEGTVQLPVPLDPDLQDRAFRNRGGAWLEAQTRNSPTDVQGFEAAYQCRKVNDADFALTGGTYGTHLKAIVEAFVAAARAQLKGPVYRIGNREVPRMAFRIEVADEFRLDDLARQLYCDLVRYGLFMRDARGKSVRGAMVPRLYLRRLLLPYCALALSKRDSVTMTCKSFTEMLLCPDRFRVEFPRQWRARHQPRPGQLSLFAGALETSEPGPMYDDLEDEADA